MTLVISHTHTNQLRPSQGKVKFQMWTVWLGLYGVAGIDHFVKSGIPDLNGNIGHQVFAVKICCTQTPGARPFVLLQLAPTPINGKAQRLAFGGLMATSSFGERILCALLLPCGGASDRDRDLGGATLLSSPTTTSTATNIGASVTKQSHQPLTVLVNVKDGSC